MNRISSLGAGLAAVIGLAVAPIAASASAQAAQAEGGIENYAPVRPANQAMTLPGQFVLNSDHDVELVRFSRPHDMTVCLPSRMDVADRPGLEGTEAYPVTVTWDNDTAEIQPGNCLSFDAARLKVSPPPNMPKSAHVVGRLTVFG